MEELYRAGRRATSGFLAPAARLDREIAKSGHLFTVIADDLVDLLRGQDVLPLARMAFAEKAVQVLRLFPEAIRFFLSSQFVE
jgi:hypothetical protein